MMSKATISKYPETSGAPEATPPAAAAHSTVVRRVTVRRFFLERRYSIGSFASKLCEKTVDIAKMAPSPVDMEAATIAMRTQPPMKGLIG